MGKSKANNSENIDIEEFPPPLEEHPPPCSAIGSAIGSDSLGPVLSATKLWGFSLDGVGVATIIILSGSGGIDVGVGVGIGVGVICCGVICCF